MRPDEIASPIVFNLLGNDQLEFARIITPDGFDITNIEDNRSLVHVGQEIKERAIEVLKNK